ncbi:P-loop ATPase, Sll1717 family [Vibrio vulnificus]
MIVVNIRDAKLFGNEAGEDEDLDVLNSYYIDNDEFYDFFDSENRLSVVSARKGMGKSALLSRLEYKLKNDSEYEQPIVIRVTGNELLGLGDFSSKDQAYLENYWKRIICKKVIIEIGSQIGFALSSDEIAMVESAELDGLKSKNFIGGLLARVKGKIPLVNAELKDNIPDNLESLLSNYQAKNENSKVWILIDDIDSKYVDTEDYQARVGSFFSAIRSLAFNTKNLNIRSTVRSDVWLNLRHLEDLDKWEQYIIEIVWTNRHMRDMLANKILSYVKRNHPGSDEAKLSYTSNYGRLFQIVFDTPIEWKGKTDASIWEAIAAFSNKRPRWMGQLCRMSAIQSKRSNSRNRKIQFRHIDEILESFGKNRKHDLIKEHKHQFSELDALIDCFRARDKEYTYNELNDVIETHYIRGRDSDDIPTVDGIKYKSAEDLGAFLYKLGLISHKQDVRTFTHYCDNPDLFKTIENRENKLVWAIHLSYRKFLNIR